MVYIGLYWFLMFKRLITTLFTGFITQQTSPKGHTLRRFIFQDLGGICLLALQLVCPPGQLCFRKREDLTDLPADLT